MSDKKDGGFNKVLALCMSSGVMLLVLCGFLVSGMVKESRSLLADLESRVGKPVVVAGMTEATIVTLDEENIYVLGRMDGGPASIRKIARGSSLFEPTPDPVP